MEGRGNGGARKISIGSRPKSGAKQRKPVRRRYTPTSNAVIFPNNPKRAQPTHSSTNFPLFSDSASLTSPQIPQAVKLNQVSSRHRQSVTHFHVQNSQKNGTNSPTPVEETPLSGRGSRLTLRSDVSRISNTVHITNRGNISPSLSEYSGFSSPSITSEDIFPFQYLPNDCKLKVFSFLSSHEKGRCAKVGVHFKKFCLHMSLAFVKFILYPLFVHLHRLQSV